MSKFKVGDKVVKADGEKWVTGEKYKKITSENSLLGYTVNSSLGYWKEEELELYKEGKTEKTFKEVIANIKEGEVWESTIKTVSLINGAINIERKNKIETYYIYIKESELFKLQRKEYTFQEAFKAYEEGKEIESCEGCKFKRCDKDVVLIIDFAGDKIKRGSCEDLFSIKEIRGKWYIND